MMTRQKLTTKFICTVIMGFISLVSMAQETISASEVEKKDIDGTEKYFYNDKLMDGYYKVFYQRRYKVAIFKNGIEGDTVRYYDINDNTLNEERIGIKQEHGVRKTYWSGSLRSSEEYSYGVRNGECKWYSNGRLEKIENYLDGKCHGLWREWWQNGQLKSEKHYVDDNLHGLNRQWGEDGKIELVENYENGAHKGPTYYWRNSESFDLQITYYGKRRSYLAEEYKIDDSGNKKLMRRYAYSQSGSTFERYYEGYDSTRMDTLADGRLAISCYKEGKLRTTEEYTDYFERHGLFTTYSPEGKVLCKRRYKYNDLLEEKWYYSDNGVSVKEISIGEYQQLLANNYNVQLEEAPAGYSQEGERELSIQTQVGEKMIKEEWKYDPLLGYEGYYPVAGLHFISRVDTEDNDKFYLVNDKSGEQIELSGCQQIAICKTTGLFAEIGIVFGKEQYLRILKMDEETGEDIGTLVEYDFGYDTGKCRIREGMAWISENALVIHCVGEKHRYMQIDIDPEKLDVNHFGLTVTKITAQEYKHLLADSCNLQLVKDVKKYFQTDDSLIIHTRPKELVFLNFPADHDNSTWWEYQKQNDYMGYATSLEIHFFRRIELDYIYNYVVSDLKGEITDILNSDEPVVCQKSNLFATNYQYPDDNKSRLFIYQVSDSGRVTKVAYTNYDYNYDIQNMVWIDENSLAVSMYNSVENQYNHICMDIETETPEQNKPLPLSTLNPEEQNLSVRKDLIAYKEEMQHKDASQELQSAETKPEQKGGLPLPLITLCGKRAICFLLFLILFTTTFLLLRKKNKSILWRIIFSTVISAVILIVCVVLKSYFIQPDTPNDKTEPEMEKVPY